MCSVHGVNVLDTLKRLISISGKIVVMDGFLQQSSIDLFNHISDTDIYAV